MVLTGLSMFLSPSTHPLKQFLVHLHYVLRVPRFLYLTALPITLGESKPRLDLSISKQHDGSHSKKSCIFIGEGRGDRFQRFESKERCPWHIREQLRHSYGRDWCRKEKPQKNFLLEILAVRNGPWSCSQSSARHSFSRLTTLSSQISNQLLSRTSIQLASSLGSV